MTLELPTWYRQRRYLHFDEPMGFLKAKTLVENPDAVAKHAFWPLISYEIETSKIKEDPATGVLIEKLKSRGISYAAHSDSHILSYYCGQISKAYENVISQRGLGDSVLAFRSLGKNNIDFAKQAFDEIRRQGDCTAIAFDISKFFDTLDHKLLKEAWKRLLDVEDLPPDHFAVFKSLAKFSTVNRDKLLSVLDVSTHNPRSGGRRRLCEPEDFRLKVRDGGLIEKNVAKKGIPQGTSISALLSNVYMLEFDVAAQKMVAEAGGTYLRYCDDMLFIVPTMHQEHIRKFAEESIKNILLEVNPDKTDVCSFSKVIGSTHLSASKPLQYLGFLFDGQRILIRSAAFAKYSNRMRRGISLAKQTMRSRNQNRVKNGLKERELFLKKIYSRYSHLGQRNFLRYGYKAAKIMGSIAIRRQLRPLWSRLQIVLAKE